MIRYDREYNATISKVVSNFNRKIARLERIGGGKLPAKVSIRAIKSQYTNRAELNRYLRELQRFSKRGAENIVNINGEHYTNYEVDIFKRRLKSERSRTTKDIKVAQSYQSATPMQHDIYLANLITRREELSKSWQEIIGEKFGQKLLIEPSRNVQTYDNLLETLFVDAYQVDFEDEKIEYIKSRLLRLRPRQLMRALEDDPNIQAIFDYYHSLTRTSGGMSNEDIVEARRTFQELYENIDAIIERYK